MSRKEWLVRAKSKLNNTENPKLEAELILAFSLGLERINLLSSLDLDLSLAEISRADAFLVRREADEPLAYLTEQKEFYSLNFIVSPATLIPRADSETIVDYVLANVQKEKLRILDLGTGTGCLALTLLHHNKNWQAHLLDINPQTLEIAKKNAEALGLIQNCNFVLGDFTQALNLALKFDLIIANPPYISDEDYANLDLTVQKYEPKLALTSDLHGYADLFKIIDLAPKLLQNKGLLLMEHGFGQESLCLEKFRQNSAYTECRSLKDLSGKNRVLLGQIL